MIIKSIGFCEFQDAFTYADRAEQFSYEGLKALYDYLTELSEDIGEDIELDVIALCVEYSEEDEELFDEDYSDCYEVARYNGMVLFQNC